MGEVEEKRMDEDVRGTTRERDVGYGESLSSDRGIGTRIRDISRRSR